MFSIIIPTFNNLDYLKICLDSLKKNSILENEVIIHVNDGSDGTLDYLNSSNYRYTFSKENLGVCSAVNLAVSKSKTNYLLYAHDDMYFLPDWDVILKKELLHCKDNFFYLSGTMMGPDGLIKLDCGSTHQNFDEEKLLKHYAEHNLYNYQGTHWAPHLIHKDIWNKVSGFSEEFNPGAGSDPDLNMKLWNEGVRYFKGINNFKVYHFGSVSLRKKKAVISNNGHQTFLRKWKISIRFFKKHHLRSMQVFEGLLSEPEKNFSYYYELVICKIKLFYLIFFSK